MAGMINAKCDCGFETDFAVGCPAGHQDMICHAPSLCLQCRKFQIKNYLAPRNNCSECDHPVTFYNDPLLSRHRPANESINTPYFVLPDSECLCPQCRQMTLRFTPTGCWE